MCEGEVEVMRVRARVCLLGRRHVCEDEGMWAIKGEGMRVRARTCVWCLRMGMCLGIGVGMGRGHGAGSGRGPARGHGPRR